MVSTRTSLTVPTQAEVIQMAADWVEYANIPDDGINRGGGVNWAHERTLNGHPEPYGVRIWNIGNEPRGPTQPFNFNVVGNAAAFAALAQPIIAASDYMKIVSDQIAPWLPGRLVSLGTDGFGRSDNREHLRKHFEVDSAAIVAATLSRLARDGKFDANRAAAAIVELGLQPESVDPSHV